MKTILPSYFVFSRATSLYQKTIRKVIPGKLIILGLTIAVTLVILFIVIEKSHLKRHPEINLENAANDTTTCMTSLLNLHDQPFNTNWNNGHYCTYIYASI